MRASGNIGYLPPFLGGSGGDSGDVFVAADEAAMLALAATKGDKAKRTDTGEVFQLVTEDPTVLGNWVVVADLTAAWSSITGKPTTLAGYGITDAAPTNSPAFSGTVTLPSTVNGSGSVNLTAGGTNGAVIVKSTGTGSAQIANSDSSAYVSVSTGTPKVNVTSNGAVSVTADTFTATAPTSVSLNQNLRSIVMDDLNGITIEAQSHVIAINAGDGPIRFSSDDLGDVVGARLEAGAFSVETGGGTRLVIGPGGQFTYNSGTGESASIGDGSILLEAAEGNSAAAFTGSGFSLFTNSGDYALSASMAGVVSGTLTATTSGDGANKIALTSTGGKFDSSLIPTDSLSLQIRRGTDGERAVVTFANGELVRTTDTNKLWIGNGSTMGGIPAVPIGYNYVQSVGGDSDILNISDAVNSLTMNAGTGVVALNAGGIIALSSASHTTIEANEGSVYINAGDGMALNSGSGPLSLLGGMVFKRVSTAINYTVLVTDFIVSVTNTAAARTITLPPASNVRHFIIKDESGGAATNNITIDPDGSELIDGAATKVINTNYGSVRCYSNGSAWFTY